MHKGGGIYRRHAGDNGMGDGEGMTDMAKQMFDWVMEHIKYHSCANCKYWEQNEYMDHMGFCELRTKEVPSHIVIHYGMTTDFTRCSKWENKDG